MRCLVHVLDGLKLQLLPRITRGDWKERQRVQKPFLLVSGRFFCADRKGIKRKNFTNISTICGNKQKILMCLTMSYLALGKSPRSLSSHCCAFMQSMLAALASANNENAWNLLSIQLHSCYLVDLPTAGVGPKPFAGPRAMIYAHAASKIDLITSTRRALGRVFSVKAN
jgi:hypothetical protein